MTKEIKTREVNDVEVMHVKIDETDSLVEMDSNEYCAKAVETSEIDHSTKDAKKPSTEENFKTEQKYDEELEHEETTATKKKKKVNKQKLYKKNVQSQKEDEFVDMDVSESVGFKLHSLKTKPSSKKKKPKKNEAENEEELEVMQVMNTKREQEDSITKFQNDVMVETRPTLCTGTIDQIKEKEESLIKDSAKTREVDSDIKESERKASFGQLIDDIYKEAESEQIEGKPPNESQEQESTMPSFDTDESVEFVSKELQSVKEPCIREMATNIDLMKENAHVAKNILDDESRSRRSPIHTTNSQKAIEQVPISGDQGQFFISFFFGKPQF